MSASNSLAAIKYKKQSPDVETPGLLVKALISSYFKADEFCSKDTISSFTKSMS